MTSAVAETGDATICLAIEAMATRFELVLPPVDLPPRRLRQGYGGPPKLHAKAGGGSHEIHSSESHVRAIGEEALAEIARLESHLSCHQPASDVSWINAHAGRRAVQVAPELFALLRRCVELSEATAGAFDITVGPLMRAWHFDRGLPPDTLDPQPEMIAGARTSVGYQHLHLDPRASTIRFARPGMRIDLGAAGKGYAIDRAIEILRDHGITSALLHGGTSSVHALGAPPGAAAWTVAWAPPAGRPQTIELRDRALSISAAHGKAFTRDGRMYGHVMDPRTGAPAQTALTALVTGTGSLECDALSTALLVLGREWRPALRSQFRGYDGTAC